MRLSAEHAGRVTLAGGIIGEHDITGFENALHAIAGFYFPGAGKGYQELASRRRMAIEKKPGGGGAKNGVGGGSRLGRQHRLIAAKVELDLLEMGLLIVTGIQPDDFHLCAPYYKLIAVKL
jgi:hypothetical protein